MTSNKTPYEVRLDVMKMALEMLDREYQTKELVFHEKLAVLRSRQASPNDINSFIDTQSPKTYNSSDVLAKSQALYSFISNKEP
jgi:hypothetical protein